MSDLRRCKTCNAVLEPQRTEKGEYRIYCNQKCHLDSKRKESWFGMYHRRGATQPEVGQSGD